MLWVIATITTAPGRDQDVLNALREVAPTVREEAGCHCYHPSQDAPTGLTPDDRPRADTVTVIEAWASRQALEDHIATPHMVRFREFAEALVVERDIRVLAPA
jgi:quinol monooxygenase YgiN